MEISTHRMAWERQQQQQQYLFGKEQPGCQKGHRPIKAGHPKVK